jgi:hypothetical protein
MKYDFTNSGAVKSDIIILAYWGKRTCFEIKSKLKEYRSVTNVYFQTTIQTKQL